MSIKIVQGEDRSIKILLKTEAGSAYDITGISEITADFRLAAGGVLSKTLTGTEITVDSAAGGEITISLEDADTALLATGNQSFEVVTDLTAGPPTGERRIFQFEKQLNVEARLIS